MESQLSRLVIDSVFPRFCVGCRREGTLWCDRCDELHVQFFFSPSCPFCRRSGSQRTCLSCRAHTFLDGLTAMEAYANPKIHEAIQIWKYYQDVAVEPVLYRWLQQAHKRMQIPILPLYAAPIPLHRQRARERGFDQANRVALWVEQLYGLPVEPLLMRNRYTLPQAKQSGRSVGELDQVFSLHPDVVEVPEHVLLCDDVFTSGATMDAAARVLKQAGARTVWGFVLGRS